MRKSRDFTGAWVAALTLAAGSSEARAQCHPAGEVVRVPELTEASGIAASRTHPDRLWAINDSGEPVIYALNARGAVAGHIRLTGVKVEDWEALTIGACPGGSCLYVGDIGDNSAKRAHITIHRLPEPADVGDRAASSEVIHATYPDGPQDAEALAAAPDGRLYVVTKGETGSVSLYRFPRALPSGGSVRLERVGKPRDDQKSRQGERITDAAISPQGDWMVLRTSRALTFHRTKALIGGDWQPAHVVDLTSLREPQGEAVTFAGDNAIVVAGEGGGKAAAGTFARLACDSLQ